VFKDYCSLVSCSFLASSFFGWTSLKVNSFPIKSLNLSLRGLMNISNCLGPFRTTSFSLISNSGLNLRWNSKRASVFSLVSSFELERILVILYL